MTKENISSITVLGMGGTIAGLAANPKNSKEYKAGELGVADLIKNIAPSNAFHLDVHNVAQINSKDMLVGHWQALLAAVHEAVCKPRTHAVVITHGTDTLEETAHLLQAMGPWPKPLVLTCAMLPANAPQADGPGNLKDALSWALQSTTGVFVVCAGKVHTSQDVQKITTENVDAFTSGPQGCWATWIDGQWQIHARPYSPSQSEQRPSLAYALAAKSWPRVEMVTNHALNDGAVVRGLLANSGSEETPLAGIVLAGTGMGTASQELEQALQKAVNSGVRVWLSSRCIFGLAHAQTNTVWGEITLLSAAKARTALCLSLLAEKEHQS
jgi:L-asparaginase